MYDTSVLHAAAILALTLVGCAPRLCPLPQPCHRWSDAITASQCEGQDHTYRSSRAEEQARERELFAQLFAAARKGRAEVEALAPVAARHGLRFIICSDTVVVAEEPTARHGRGAYVIALGDASELFIQVPHSFTDLRTFEMGIEMFAASHARALAVSTVPRDAKADVAHDPSSMFQSVTAAWLAVTPQDPIVQLHGFGDTRVFADAVVTSGASERGAPWLLAIRDRLRALLPGRIIAAFPDDVNDLGATTNSQGHIVRATGGRFLHIEMSASLRESLRRRDADRRKFLDELAASLLPSVQR